MDLFMKAFTTIALTQATGLNPVLPVLLISIMGRFESFFISHGWPAPISLPDNLKFMASLWAISFFAIITLLEAVLDKTQWLDNVKHVTIDPILSSFASAGTTFAVMANPISKAMYSQTDIMNGLPACLCMTGMEGAGFWVAMILFIIFGLFVTLSFLFIKTALRWVLSALPDMGISNFLVSLLEDVIVIISVFLAFFAPVLALIFTLLLGGCAVGVIMYLRRRADEREKSELRNLCFIQGIM